MSEYNETLKLVAKPIIINALHKRPMCKDDLVAVLRTYETTRLHAARLAHEIMWQLADDEIAEFNYKWELELKKKMY